MALSKLQMIFVVKSSLRLLSRLQGSVSRRTQRGACGMEKHLSWIHSGDLHKARSEDGKTEYYTAFFEEWEIPVVMLPQNKQRGALRVCTFNFSPCTNQTKHGVNANTHGHAWAQRKTLRCRYVLYTWKKPQWFTVLRHACTHDTHTWQTTSEAFTTNQRAGVCVICRSSDCFPRNRRPAADLMPCSVPRGEQATSDCFTGGWLGRCQNRKQIWKIVPVKASHSGAEHTHTHTAALVHAHTKGRIIPPATWKQEAAGRMPGSTTWRQRSSTSGGGGADVHLGFNMLMDPACEVEREACVFVCTKTWIYLSLQAMYAPSMPQFGSLQLISLT